ncbi:O-antigen ligase family protein [Caballeronia sp. LZ031]|uniref:O-antigen ligase family protein n=1 Tax=Caballeronia sp. LZ031 TaxID=3038556 RepID=UPI002860ACE0|nr:O-antigen ligase family protein [Caballeronia sp. LZ031]MDR5839649.1 O-antigen ligase family protein [Caballeronia sp. LZ031]
MNLALGGMSGEEFAAQTVFILKVFSFFVYLAALSRLNGRQLAFLERFVVAALFVYAAAIIAGALFSIEAFRSYQDDTQIRSGYKGIVYAQNEASALMVAGLAYVYSRVLRFGWRPLEGVLVFCVFCASLLVGTKAAAVGACAVFVVYCYARHSVMGATVRAGIAIALIAGVAVTAYLTLPSIADAVDLSIRYFLYQYDNMRSENGLLSIVLSGRDLKFEQIAGEIARLDYLPLLTGGFPVVRYLVEIDVPDLALCLGVPVFVFYLRALKRGFVVARSGRVARFGTLFFVVLLLIACTAGHALNSAVVSPFLAVLATIVQRGEEPRTQGE